MSEEKSGGRIEFIVWLPEPGDELIIGGGETYFTLLNSATRRKMTQSWFDQIVERRAAVWNPPVRHAEEMGEDGTLELYGEDGPVGAWDGLDTAGVDWVTKVHADEGMLIQELQRVKGNYSEGLGLLDELINRYARTLPENVRHSIIDLRGKLRGLT